MDMATESTLRSQLTDRRRRLQGAISDVGEAADLVRLLQEVDSALTRMDAQAYGSCEVCHETVDDDFLFANPAIQYCLCNLTPSQQQALQNDLELAARIQWALLPPQDLSVAGWDVHYRYEPAGPVSGDYCDAVSRQKDGENLFVLVGDVSGKGIAASLLMAHLNAMFRSLIELGLPVQDMVTRANGLFSGSTLSSQYATLVCARAGAAGEIEICNAGHCPPMVVRDGGVATVDATGFPVGMVRSGPYELHRLKLSKGDTLFLYTDGLTEALDAREHEYGAERLSRFLSENRALSPGALAAACLEDQAGFRSGVPRADDLTLVVVRRTA